MTTSWNKNTFPGGHEIYNFGRLFLDHRCHILCLSDLCMRIEKMFLKEKYAFLLNDICAITPATGVMKSTIFVDPGHHCYSLCEHCPGVGKNIF